MKIDWILDIKVYCSILEEEFPFACADIIKHGVIQPGTYIIDVCCTELELDLAIEKLSNDVKVFGAHRHDNQLTAI